MQQQQQVLAPKSAEHVPKDLDLTCIASQVAEAEAVVRGHAALLQRRGLDDPFPSKVLGQQFGGRHGRGGGLLPEACSKRSRSMQHKRVFGSTERVICHPLV